MTRQQIIDRMRDRLRTLSPGDCRVLSLGTDCPCGLCDLERLLNLTWQPMETAPKTGPVKHIVLLVEREHWAYQSKQQVQYVVKAHWAFGDGDGLMPAFGPAWFEPVGTGYHEVYGKLLGWMECPEHHV